MKAVKRLGALSIALLCASTTYGQNDAAPAGDAAAGGFTAEQAERGSDLYMANCASCHARNLRGGANEFAAPGLTGPFFFSKWEGSTWGDLLSYAQQTMPPGAGGSLATDEYVDIFAFIIQRAGYEPGDAPLTLDSPILKSAIARAGN